MAANPFLELRQSFKFLRCAAQQDVARSKCSPAGGTGSFPKSIRDTSEYTFCLFLVASIAQFEAEIDSIQGVTGLARAGKLATKIRLLKDHYGVSDELFDRIDRIRLARNRVVHEGEKSVDAGCTMNDVPGILVSYLQACRHSDYT